jgi:hypothetical protein
VVRGHRAFVEAFAQVPGDTFRHAPGVDENQGSAVGADERCQPVVDLRPHLARHHRFQRRAGKLDA